MSSDILNMCLYVLEKTQKCKVNSLTWYEFIEKIQKCKINSLTWYEISEKIQKSKINSLTWYDFIDFHIFRGPIMY